MLISDHLRYKMFSARKKIGRKFTRKISVVGHDPGHQNILLVFPFFPLLVWMAHSFWYIVDLIKNLILDGISHSLDPNKIEKMLVTRVMTHNTIAKLPKQVFYGFKPFDLKNVPFFRRIFKEWAKRLIILILTLFCCQNLPLSMMYNINIKKDWARPLSLSLNYCNTII